MRGRAVEALPRSESCGSQMKDVIKRICELQPHYSFQNTPEMQERGAALRRRLKPAIERMEPSFAEALGEFGDEFSVEASHGISRKTELPWARLSSRRMSPNPTLRVMQLGHYEILSALAKGAMGEVWSARDSKLGREVAIKTLSTEFARDEERLARFD